MNVVDPYYPSELAIGPEVRVQTSYAATSSPCDCHRAHSCATLPLPLRFHKESAHQPVTLRETVGCPQVSSPLAHLVIGAHSVFLH